MSSAGARAATSIDNLRRSFTSFFAKLAGGVSILQTIKNTLKEAANFQQIQLSFQTLLGSQQKAALMIQEIRKISSSTGFDFDQVADASRLYLALGGSAQTATRDIKAVSAQAAAMGKGADQIDRVVLALGQVKAKGFLSGEEVRQLANNNVKVWQYLTKVLNVDVGTAMDMARKKMIDADAAVQVILKGMQDEFGGALDKRLSAVPGAFDRLVNSIKVAMAEVGNSFFEVVGAVDVLISAGNSVEAIGHVITDTIRELGGLGPKFQDTEMPVRALVDALHLLRSVFLLLVEIRVAAWLITVAQSLYDAAVAARAATGAFGAITTVTGGMVAFAVVVAAVSAEFGSWASKMASVQTGIDKVLYGALKLSSFGAKTGLLGLANPSTGAWIDKQIADMERLSAQKIAYDAELGRSNKTFVQSLKDDFNSIQDGMFGFGGSVGGAAGAGFGGIFSSSSVQKSLKQIDEALKASPPVEIAGKLVMDRDQIQQQITLLESLMQTIYQNSPQVTMLKQIGDLEIKLQDLTAQMGTASDAGGSTGADLAEEWRTVNETLAKVKESYKALGEDKLLKQLLPTLAANQELKNLTTKAAGTNFEYFSKQVEASAIKTVDFVEQLQSLKSALTGVDASPFKEITKEQLLLNSNAEDSRKLFEKITKSLSELKAEQAALNLDQKWDAGAKMLNKYRVELERLNLTRDAAASTSLDELSMQVGLMRGKAAIDAIMSQVYKLREENRIANEGISLGSSNSEIAKQSLALKELGMDKGMEGRYALKLLVDWSKLTQAQKLLGDIKTSVAQVREENALLSADEPFTSGAVAIAKFTAELEKVAPFGKAAAAMLEPLKKLFQEQAYIKQTNEQIKTFTGNLDSMSGKLAALQDANERLRLGDAYVEGEGQLLKYKAQVAELDALITKMSAHNPNDGRLGDMIHTWIKSLETLKQLEAAAKENKQLQLLGDIAKSTGKVREENEALLSGDPWGAGSREIIKYRAELERLGMTQDVQAKKALDALEKLYEQQNRLQAFKKIADTIGDAFGSAFEDVIFGAKSVGEAMKSMLEDISKAVIHNLVTQPIAQGISSFAMQGFAALLGNAAGSGFNGGGWNMAPGSYSNVGQGGQRPIGSALGNIFRHGSIVPFALGGMPDMVHSPTYFPMSGGRMGLMGEAGSEAIMPLKRGAGGRLGVEGGMTQKITNVTMNITTKDEDSFRRSTAQTQRRLRNL